VKKLEFKYFYTVTPTNFITLPEEKQMRKLGEFFNFLRTLEHEIHIVFSRKMLEVPIEGQMTDMPIIQIQISAKEPLDDIFDRLKFEYSIDEEHSTYDITKEHLRYFKIKNNVGSDAYGKCMALHSVPASLPAAWIHSVFSACDRVDLYITPIRQDKAIKVMESKSRLLYDRATKSPIIRDEYNKVEAIKSALKKSTTSLFHVTVNCVIVGPTLREMKKSVKAFRKNSSITGGKFSATMSKQAAMIKEGWGAKLTMDIGSTSILYAFVSADMLEVPNGVVLGINVDSGAPVIFDPAKRTNYNFAIIGKSGSGKSFTVKIFLKRFLEKYPDCLCFVIDPMGEYHSIASYLGLDAIQITENEEFGFDPFKMLDPLDAVDILGQATKASDKVVKQWRSLANDVNSIDELHEKSDEEGKKYLIDLVKGPLSKIMKGEPKMSDRIIISMKGTGGEDYTVLILLLALNKIWKRIVSLPANRQKILLIDEGWMLFKMPGAEKYIDMIVRMGRKLNVKFIFVSQKVEDLANEKGGYGKIIDNIETKVLMLMEEDAANKAASILKLSPHEVNKITSFEAGNGIFITSKHRIHVKFEATPDERDVHFNTTPEPESQTDEETE